MHRLFLPIILLFLATTACAQDDPETQESSPPRVFYLNLAPDSCSVLLSNDETAAFEAILAPPFSACAISVAESDDQYTLMFETADEDGYQFVESDGDIFEFELVNDGIYCILRDSQGVVDLLDITGTGGPGAMVAMLNATRDSIFTMEIAASYGDNNVAYSTDFDSNSMTFFENIQPGSYAIFWETPENRRNGRFTFIPNPDQTPHLLSFLAGHWYVFACYDRDGAVIPDVFDITP
jgi:hypothetical protein